MGYKSKTQEKNLCWYLPRPKPDKYKGGMPLYAESWLLKYARDLLGKQDASILNLFCGMNVEGFRVDINQDVEPDLVCDAHELTKHLDKTFDIILADPPYSNQEAEELYQTPSLKYKVWSTEAIKLLNVGGLFIIYHKFLMPNPVPSVCKNISNVCIINRTYHTPRIARYFLKHSIYFV